MVALINAQVADLQGQGADAIIALTHVGYLLDQSLAAKTAGIGLFIGGHSHTPLGPQPNKQGEYPTPVTNAAGENVPVLTDWEWGRWLGVFEVGFDDQGRVSEITGTPLEVIADIANAAYVTPDAALEARITTDYKPPLELLRTTKIGTTNVALNGSRTDVRAKETNLGSLIADALLEKTSSDGAEVALINGGGVRASIAGPDVTVGNVLEVLPFGNTIALVTLTGQQLLDALENGVSQIELGAGRFPQVAGLRFEFSTNLPALQRILSVEIENADGTFGALNLTADYRVVTNNFMLGGGDGYATLAAGSNKVDSGLIMADVVQDYLAANSPVTADTVTLGRISRSYYLWLSQITTTTVVVE